jgi:hypothetical protein
MEDAANEDEAFWSSSFADLEVGQTDGWDTLRNLRWRIQLGYASFRSDWRSLRALVKQQRADHARIRALHVVSHEELERELERQDPNVCHPLTAATDSAWFQYFSNLNLEEQLRKDLDRLQVGGRKLKEGPLRTILENVLFVYCKENAELSYRQGMHELAAMVLEGLLSNTQKSTHDKTHKGSGKVALFGECYRPEQMRGAGLRIAADTFRGAATGPCSVTLAR